MDIQTICGNQERNGTYIELDQIPNSKNSLFTYNKFIGGSTNEEYITSMAIISEEERNTVLEHWNQYQERNESQFERDYMNSAMQKRTEQVEDIETELKSFNYMMLDRLRIDCDYFLGNGNGQLKHLYYKDVDKHIEKMKKIYNSFSEEEKPEWISLNDINNYKDKMTEMLEKDEEEEM